jgi:DnaJ-class molecular chaperone
MWQKCPVCNGSGKIPFYPEYFVVPQGYTTCNVCKGYGIISKETGLPPTRVTDLTPLNNPNKE